MSSLRGPRRTRVYDANYNLGQSYYKPTIDQLDRKYNGRLEFKPDPLEKFPIVENGFDDDLKAMRARASRAITEESVFDSRGGRTTKGIPLSSAFDETIDEDIQDSLNRMRASKSTTKSLINDFDLEDSINSIKRRSNRELGDKLINLAGEDELGDSIRSRAIKMVTRAEDDPKSVNFKRTLISDVLESKNTAASMRAQASKARLADIESEMFERSEKLLEREKRAANLKKVLADNDIENIKLTKHVTF